MSDEKKSLKIRVPENLQAGVYANNTMVTHSREEFVLDFLMMAPGGANVVSRVVVTPSHMKRMLATLQDNIRKYEQKFETIASHDIPPTTMGFSG